MHDTKNKFLSRILDKTEPDGQEAKSYGKERQLSTQAFNLHVECRDGRRSEGFGWSHYVGYQWTDEGTRERLVVVFAARAVEIEGHNLVVLVNEIRDGQLNSIRELTTRQVTQLKNENPEGEPVIENIHTYPDLEDILKEIKGENDDHHRHSQRAAGH